MSYILEALKRSESERNQGEVPNLNSYHMPVRSDVMAQSRQHWYMLLIGFLLALLIALSVYLYFSNSETSIQKPTRPQVAPTLVAPSEVEQSSDDALVFQGEESSVTEGYAEQSLDTSDETVELEEDEWVTVSPRTSQSNQLAQSAEEQRPSVNMTTASSVYEPESTQVVTEEGYEIIKPRQTQSVSQEIAVSEESLVEPEVIRPASAEAVYEELASSGDDESLVSEATPEETIPLLYDMPDLIQSKVPNLAFNGHLYSNIPSARQVSINGRKLREGDWLQNLQISEITRDGVVFELDTQKFKLLF